MADISILSRLVNGYQKNIDVSQNSLIVGSIKIGTSTPVEITKTIATKLLAIQAAADSDGTYDTRYFTKTQDGSTTVGSSGAKNIGVSGTPTNYTPATPDVQAHLSGIDTALAAVGVAGKVKNTSADTTADYLNNKITVSAGLLKTTTSPAGNEKLNLAVDPTVYIAQTEKGANSGVATLDSGGKVPVAQLPNSVMEYKGTYNATTNTPTLVDGTGNTGDVYRTTVAGAGVNSLNFVVGDYAIYNGSTWEKAHSGSDAVVSVQGFAGVVSLTTTDIPEGSQQYFTTERAQDSVAAALTATATITPTYNDAGNQITHDVNTNSLDSSHLKTTTTDQDTILGGNNTPFNVDHAPKVQTPEVAGESFAATTLWAIRYAVAADAGFVAGRVYKADIDSSVSDKFDVQGLAYPPSLVSAAGAIKMVQNGLINVPSHGFTVGLPLWLAASGAVTQTAPSTVANQAVVKLGTVKDANNINVKIQIMSAG